MSEAAGATLWWIGDWLAYGDKSFPTSGPIAYGLRGEISRLTGYAEQTLTNARCVCAALPLNRRRVGLTFGHAAEIVGRASPEEQDKWIERVVREGLSVKALREQLRAAKSTVPAEPGDVAADSFLETTRQYLRDYMASPERPLSPAYRAEIRKILAPLLKDIG